MMISSCKGRLQCGRNRFWARNSKGLQHAASRAYRRYGPPGFAALSRSDPPARARSGTQRPSRASFADRQRSTQLPDRQNAGRTGHRHHRALRPAGLRSGGPGHDFDGIDDGADRKHAGGTDQRSDQPYQLRRADPRSRRQSLAARLPDGDHRRLGSRPRRAATREPGCCFEKTSL